MEKLAEILKDLEQGKISIDHAEQQVLNLFSISGAKQKLVCPHCQSGEENFTRNGHHIWCRNCDYEFNVG